MCVFCKIISGEIPCYKIYEDEETLAFLDIADDAFGHTLVIPKKHYENILDIDNRTLSKLMTVVKKISNHYVDNCGFTGVNVMNASGVDAQQSVFHLHFHIFPRKAGDGMDTWPKLSKVNSDFQKVMEMLKMY